MLRSRLPRLLMIALMLFTPGQFAPRVLAQAPAPKQPTAPGRKAAAPKPGRPNRSAAKTPVTGKVPAKPAAAGAAKNPLDLKYVAADFIAASVSHPARTLASPEFELFPIEIMQAALKKELGVDILQVEEVIALFAFTPPMPPSPAWIARFSAPVDQDAILSHVSAGEGEKIGQHDSYQLKQADLGSILFPDPQTVLIGRPEQLAKMLDADNESSPLIEHLRRVDRSEMLSAVAVLDSLQPIIQGGMAQLPPVPPQFQQFLEAPGLLSAVELHCGSESWASLVLEGTDEKAAVRLAALLEDAIGLGEQFLSEHLNQMKAEEPGEITDATEHYARRMLKLVLDSVHRQRQGKRLVISTEGGLELTSVATIGVLTALLLPAVQAAREAARRAQGSNNLKQIGLAMQNHADVFKQFPARAIYKEGEPLLSWRVKILPFVEQNELYKQFHLDEPWDSEHNRQLIAKMPPVYANPVLDAKLTAAGMTDYLAPVGPNTAFNGEEGLGFAAFKDGTSNTVMVVEANADRAVIWTKPDDFEVDADNPLGGLGSIHPGGFSALFADGHVQFLSSMLDPKVLLHLFTPNGGEAIPPGF